MNNVFFIWKGAKEELKLFVWHLGFEYRVQFTLKVERKDLDGNLLTKIYRKPTHVQQYINGTQITLKTCYWGS